jgi:hypothetical protein
MTARLGDCVDALEGASGKASVRLHMADLGLDGAATLQELG